MADDIGSRNLRLAMPGNRKGDMTYSDLTALVPWLAIGAALAIMILLLQKGRLPLPALRQSDEAAGLATGLAGKPAERDHQ